MIDELSIFLSPLQKLFPEDYVTIKKFNNLQIIFPLKRFVWSFCFSFAIRLLSNPYAILLPPVLGFHLSGLEINTYTCKKTFREKKAVPNSTRDHIHFFLNFSQVLTFSLHSLRENQEEKMEVSSVQKNNKSYFSLFSLMSEVYFYQLCYYLCAIVLYTLEIDIDIFVRFSFIH